VAQLPEWHPGEGDPLRPPEFDPKAPIPNSPSYVERHPTRYQWRDDIANYIRQIYRRFGGEGRRPSIHINTYVCHPEHPDPSIRCRDTVSYDIWGEDGRGDPIGFDRGQKIWRFLFDDPGEPFIAWIIWNRRIWIRGIEGGPGPGGFRDFGNNPFTWHEDHIHLTATGPYRRLN
jgi:hypothetical protein